MHYLKVVIDTQNIDNILEQYLFTVLSSIEGMSAVRARAILHVKVLEPLRFFANDSDLGLTPVTDEQRPHYDEWKLSRLNRKGYSVNGKQKVNTHYLVMGALFEPSDADMQSTSEETKNLLQVRRPYPFSDSLSPVCNLPNTQVLAEGFIDGMMASPMREHLSAADGEYTAEKVSPRTRLDFAHALSTSDPAEAFFGVFKYNIDHFPKMLQSRYNQHSLYVDIGRRCLLTDLLPVSRSAIALAVAQINKQMHPQGSYMKKQSTGRLMRPPPFADLTRHEQEALIEYARIASSSEIKIDQSYFALYIQTQQARQKATQDAALQKMARQLVEAQR